MSWKNLILYMLSIPKPEENEKLSEYTEVGLDELGKL